MKFARNPCHSERRSIERKHLTRELHDQVIQDLLSTNYEPETIGTGIPESTELSIFRIIQEGLSNLYRRADATRWRSSSSTRLEIAAIAKIQSCSFILNSSDLF